MSKVAITGNTSGTGTFTIAAPNSNTDRTLTLPDEAGTVLTSASSIPVANLDSAVGITHVDHWRITTNQTAATQTEETFTSNWERTDIYYPGFIGTAMTESSGTFSFPVTGIWRIEFTLDCSDSSDTRQIESYIYVSNDSGSSYNQLDMSRTNITNVGGAQTYTQSHNLAIIDVTNASVFRIQFRAYDIAGGTTYRGNTTVSQTAAVFTRLGDT